MVAYILDVDRRTCINRIYWRIKIRDIRWKLFNKCSIYTRSVFARERTALRQFTSVYWQTRSLIINVIFKLPKKRIYLLSLLQTSNYLKKLENKLKLQLRAIKLSYYRRLFVGVRIVSRFCLFLLRFCSKTPNTSWLQPPATNKYNSLCIHCSNHHRLLIWWQRNIDTY